jgi:hypothetical protein
MVAPSHAARQARIGGVGADNQGIGHGGKMGGLPRRCKAQSIFKKKQPSQASRICYNVKSLL